MQPEQRRTLGAAQAKLAAKQTVRRDVGGAAKTTPLITGYGAVFYDGTPATEFTYDQVGSRVYLERLMPTAFDRAIRDRQDVRAMYNHDPNQLLGRVSAGTLKLSTDSRGLRYEINAPNNSIGNDVCESIRRGDVSGSSFMFLTAPGGQAFREEQRDGQRVVIREVTDVNLFDVGPVAFPAYDSTSVGVKGGRSAPRKIPDRIMVRARLAELTLMEDERLLRDMEADEKDRLRQLADAEARERRRRAEAMQPRVTRAEVLARVRQLDRMGL